MASKENQNLQIVVIVLAILVFILAGVAFWLNGKKTTAMARADDANTKASEAGRSEREMQAQANNYKVWIGYQEADTYDTLQESFAGDMEKYGKYFEEENRSYRNILENIFEENRLLGQNEVTAKAQVKDLTARLLSLEKEKEAQIAKHIEDKDAAIAQKESLRNDFQQQREAMIEENRKIADQLEEQRTRIDELTAACADTEKTLNQEIEKLKRMLVVLKDNQAVPDPYAQPADGEIRLVDQRQGKVWINLGTLDQLRPQVTFSVYSGDTSDIYAAESKGSIEVTQILGAHLAEARISSDEPTRPLEKGDKVYSQVWNQGRKVGFALAGIIDMNGDGVEDLAQMKSVIAMNSGKVDAMPDGKGGIVGDMTVDTRYLILGKYPEGARKEEANERRSWMKINEDATTLGIETITLDEFLNLLGWQAERRTVKLGAGARAEDFPAIMRGDRIPQDTNSQRRKFRPRKPQAAY